VSVYAKRLAEVEQKLAATRDVNTSLQSLLDKALTSQKQSSSNTSHLVKNIQMDLSRVSLSGGLWYRMKFVTKQLQNRLLQKMSS
jgi:hypothetical protein